jgi:small subunit ribosomal protein S17
VTGADPAAAGLEGPAAAPLEDQERPVAGPPGPRPEPAAPRQNRRKAREGIVVSDAMDKTAVVRVVQRVRHPRYAKTVQRTSKLYAHDEANEARVGDRVQVAECRPLSRTKRWRVVKVLERAR